MNIPVLIAGILSLLAFFAHAFVGDKEYQALKPASNSSDKNKETWVQVRSGWHWVSVDLLLSSVLLIMISVTDVIAAEKEFLILLNIYFFICGIVWFGVVFSSRNTNKQIIVLGQWIFCLIMSSLLILGQTQNA